MINTKYHLFHWDVGLLFQWTTQKRNITKIHFSNICLPQWTQGSIRIIWNWNDIWIWVSKENCFAFHNDRNSQRQSNMEHFLKQLWVSKFHIPKCHSRGKNSNFLIGDLRKRVFIKSRFTYEFKTIKLLISVPELHVCFPQDVFQTWRGNEIASPLNYSFIPSALSFSPP